MIGGENKTVQIDETFLTKRKYHRGRVTEQMSIVVLGLYCKEDKTGIFFKVDGKSKRDLWPYIKKFVHPNTSTICTDQAKQYYGVEQLLAPNCSHLTTNHSAGEFVAADNSSNTINDLENQNKHLKKSILSRRSSQQLYQYMGLYYYRKNILEKQFNCDLGSQIMKFFEDMGTVYPGYVNGQKKEGLFLKDLTVNSQDAQDIDALLPPKRFRATPIDEEFDFGSDDSTNDDYSCS